MLRKHVIMLHGGVDMPKALRRGRKRKRSVLVPLVTPTRDGEETASTSVEFCVMEFTNLSGVNSVVSLTHSLTETLNRPR